MDLPTNKNVLRWRAVLDRCGMRPTALNEAIARGDFPRPFKITDGGRLNLWLESEVDDWLKKRLAARERERLAAQERKRLAAQEP
jgi:predicted DNA-binding transcriptional regulator AlpA